MLRGLIGEYGGFGFPYRSTRKSISHNKSE